MPWQPVLKILVLPAICGLLFWFCARPCHASRTDLTGQQQDGQAAEASLKQGSGFYLAPKFLYQWQNHIDRLNIAVNGVSAEDGTYHSQGTAGAALALGYDLWPRHKLPLRAELELALRGNSHYSQGASHQGGRQSESFKCLYNATTLLAAFYYDHHNQTSFVPYLMAGAGLAFIYGNFNYRARVASEEFRISDSRSFTNFAWTVGSGLAWQFSERLAIDLGYRYLYLGRTEFSGTGKFGPSVVSYQAEDLSSIHEINLGLRICF